MSDLAALLPGFASIITAIGGVLIGLRAISKGSQQERKSAAKHVIDRVLGEGPDDEDDERYEAITEIVAKILEQREGEQ